MKILAIICEFNPFHNGHKYLIGRAKSEGGCDAVICLMSGSFTQRGEMCVNDKFLRAKHAVLGGADAVLELPAPFSVAPAEIFAKGAVSILSSIPQVKYLAFGCESGKKEDFSAAAKILNCESGLFKSVLTEKLDGGESFIKSYCAAFAECGGNAELLASPNNILAVEYVKAIEKCGADIGILPVKRIGADYNDCGLHPSYSSAGAIRANAGDPTVKDNMPNYSYLDFSEAKNNSERFEKLAADWLYLCDKRDLKRVYGCGEGLENKLKALAFGNDFNAIVEKACSKRYSKARIRRILTANLLGLYADETDEFLSSDLQPKILAVKKERADEILPYLSLNRDNSITRKCAELTSRSYGLWRYLNTPLAYDNPNEKMILV